MSYTVPRKIEFRRKFFKLFGATITATNPDTLQQVAYIRQAIKLREDIRVYTDSTRQTEILQIRARQVIDFGATYDVIDSSTDQHWLSLRRKALSSMFVRDYWVIMDAAGTEIGSLQETSSGLALARRWIDMIPLLGELISLVFAFIPQSYEITVTQPDGQLATIGTILHRRNPFIVKMLLDMEDSPETADTRIGLAATSLLAVIESSKNS